MSESLSVMANRADDARWRAAVYRNLSALFADAPSVEALRQLIDVALSVEVEDVRRVSEAEFYAYVRSLADRDLCELRVQVASEYAELFVGPRPPLAPYYESVYLGFPNRLFTEQTMMVRRFYERCGLAVVKDGKVPDDHIAYELELMAELAERESCALDAGQLDRALELERLQREFLVVHLGGWTMPFASRIAEAPCGDFYAALARFVQGFISEDDVFLAEALLAPELHGAAGDSTEASSFIPIQD